MTTRYQLAPSVYAADYLHLERQLAAMKQAGISQLHVDIMDGVFVPNLSFGPDFVAALRQTTDFYLDVHLMTERPQIFVEMFAKAGADGITVHWEACENAVEVLDAIRRLGKQAGLAVKPETPVSELAAGRGSAELLVKADRIQLMTVAPGLKGQKFLPQSIQRIEEVRRLLEGAGSRALIEVDGDITGENLGRVLTAGAEIIVVGKGLFCGELENNINEYNDVIKGYVRDALKGGGKYAVCGGN